MIKDIEGPLTKWCELNPYYNLDGKDEKPEEKGLKAQKSQLHGDSASGCKIADIVFAFNNRDLILALRARG